MLADRRRLQQPDRGGRTAPPSCSRIAALSPGTHTIYVHGKDAAGNWGAVRHDHPGHRQDRAAVSGVTLTPLPQQRRCVKANAQRRATGNANIARRRGLLDASAPLARGSADDALAARRRPSSAAHPGAAIARSARQPHDLGSTPRRGRQLGPAVTATFLIDRTRRPSPASPWRRTRSRGPGSHLTVNGAADPLVGGLASGVAGGEYWIDPPTTTTPAPGGGTPFSGLTASIPIGSLATGTYTVRVRIRDAAGNWSTGTGGIRSATLTVRSRRDLLATASTPASRPWGWSQPLHQHRRAPQRATTAAALVGTRGLQAQGNNTNYVQYNFGTAANPATAHLRRAVLLPAERQHVDRPGHPGGRHVERRSAPQLFRVRYRLNGGARRRSRSRSARHRQRDLDEHHQRSASNRIEVVWQSGSTSSSTSTERSSQTLTAGASSCRRRPPGLGD